MFKKVLAFFGSRKLAGYARFFGFMTLTLAAITGMAWAYCGLDSEKQKCRASEGAADVCAAKKNRINECL